MNRYPFFVMLLLAFNILLAPALQAQISSKNVLRQDHVTLHKIFLKFISADVVLDRQGWERNSAVLHELPMPPDGTTFSLLPPCLPFPSGVQNITAHDADNSLLVLATLAGYEYVAHMAQILDYPPRKVTIQLAFVMAASQELAASGISAGPIPAFEPASAKTFQAFLKKHPDAVTTPPMIATDIVSVWTDLSWVLQSMHTQPTLPPNFFVKILAWVNMDGTVTLSIDDPNFKTRRSVPNGETAALLCPGIDAAANQRLIMFITPTYLTGKMAQALP